MNKKNVLKIKKIMSLAIIGLVLVLPSVILAQGETEQNDIVSMTKIAGKSAGYNPEGEANSLANIVGLIARMFIGLVGIIFISYTIYGGYLWMTAAGNDEKITKAKSIITNGIIGLIVIFMAAAIYLFVRNALITGGGGAGGDSGYYGG